MVVVTKPDAEVATIINPKRRYSTYTDVGLFSNALLPRNRGPPDGCATNQEPPAGTIGLAALIACVVISVALLASWIPARRAAHIDPLLALRTD